MSILASSITGIKMKYGINIDDMRVMIQTVLTGLSRGGARKGMDSKDAVAMVLRTGIAESYFHYTRQRKKGNAIGVARGFYQIEPWVARSVINDYIEFRKSILNDIERVCICDLSMLDDDTPEEMAAMDLQLQGNIPLQIAICRMKYRPVPHPIPPADDLEAQASYWLRYYNAGGKGVVDEFVEKVRSME